MSLICLTMAFFLDLNSGDGKDYFLGSLFFVFTDIVFLGVILGFLNG